MCQEVSLVSTSHVTDEKTEAQRGDRTSPGSHDLSVSQHALSGQVPPPALCTGRCGSGRGHPYWVHAGIAAPEISWSKMLSL